MKPIDWILIGVLVVITAGVVYAIYRAKKKGKTCIGCPESGSCSGCCTSCKTR